MAYIKVDHSKFSTTASVVDSYVKLMKTKMNSAQGEVDNLARNWQGVDFAQFRTQWNKVTNGESTYSEMIKALENYSKFLRFASEKYKDAQTNAVNSANRLPRY